VPELGGEWRAAITDDDLRRAFTDPSFADERWEPITVPSHWRSASAFGKTDGPLLYRLRFENTPDLPIVTVFAQAPTAEVTMFAADGSQIAHASTS